MVGETLGDDRPASFVLPNEAPICAPVLETNKYCRLHNIVLFREFLRELFLSRPLELLLV